MKKEFRHQQGIALIEAMVAVVIFAIGILGVIGLQAVALRANADAKYRADAAYMASQIIGQMWSESRDTLTTYRHNCSAEAGCAPSCPASTNSVSGNANVTSWLTQLKAQFPTGATADNLVQISVVQVNPVLGASTQTLPTYQVAVSICWRAPNDPTDKYHNYVVGAQIS